MTDPLRIIDANANRAREAIRVMEDGARFILSNDELTRQLKQLRHDLVEALEPIDTLQLHAARDTPADIGTHLTTDSEQRRTSLRHVAIAAGKRAAEAMRSIEEHLKIETPDVAGAIERLRYRLYDLETRLVSAFGVGADQWSLCVLVTEALCEHATWIEVAEAAVEGGAQAVQLREKDLSDRELLRRARLLVERVGERAAVIINDRVDLALAAGAHGVHLGQDDLPIDAARRVCGGRLLIGVSCSAIDQARLAVEQGADYCGVGQMFSSSTKQRETLAGPGLLEAYLADPMLAGRPHLAIGGITIENAPQLAEVGGRGVAVSGAVCKNKRPAEVSRAFCEVFAPTHWGDRRRGG